jgi:hypothetical protein
LRIVLTAVVLDKEGLLILEVLIPVVLLRVLAKERYGDVQRVSDPDEDRRGRLRIRQADRDREPRAVRPGERDVQMIAALELPNRLHDLDRRHQSRAELVQPLIQLIGNVGRDRGAPGGSCTVVWPTCALAMRRANASTRSVSLDAGTDRSIASSPALRRSGGQSRAKSSCSFGKSRATTARSSCQRSARVMADVCMASSARQGASHMAATMSETIVQPRTWRRTIDHPIR